MKLKRRYQFIPELREALAKQVPFDDKEAVIGIIKHWEEGMPPRTPLEHGVHKMCEKVRDDLESGKPPGDA